MTFNILQQNKVNFSYFDCWKSWRKCPSLAILIIKKLNEMSTFALLDVNRFTNKSESAEPDLFL